MIVNGIAQAGNHCFDRADGPAVFETARGALLRHRLPALDERMLRSVTREPAANGEDVDALFGADTGDRNVDGIDEQLKGPPEWSRSARALCGNVKLLLLDEPFEGLAPNIVKELLKMFDELRGRTSIIIVEHNLDLVLDLADRVFVLDRGAVIHRGPARPLLTDLAYRKQILWV